MQGLLVRDACCGDAAAIADLLGELGYPNDPGAVETRIAKLMDGSGGKVLVAEVNSGVVGFISVHMFPAFHLEGNWCRITALVVTKDWRRKGVGRRLMEAAESWARRNGCVRMEVTSGDHREDAHGFYGQMGFEERPRRFLKFL